MYEKINGAKRLVNALIQHDDKSSRARLAQILDYYERQLNEDIEALGDYLREAEERREKDE
ncbi:MAG: hypothetical protein J6A59_10190 [Lachnospiraceae bacterium]|nr:hypothetical protein [Lachnospiraceae bacterium]